MFGNCTKYCRETSLDIADVPMFADVDMKFARCETNSMAPLSFSSILIQEYLRAEPVQNRKTAFMR